MDTVDELMTPGCPNCAVKHLSAALAYFVDSGDTKHEIIGLDDAPVFVGRAVVNLVESLNGYPSHFDFAIGLIERAEEKFTFTYTQTASSPVGRLRRIRLALTDGTMSASFGAAELYSFARSYGMMLAHVAEALRELRSIPLPAALTAEWFRDTIAEVKKEYFDFGETEGKGGEEVMACGTKKAAKAACKGGKCAPAKKAPMKKGKK